MTTLHGAALSFVKNLGPVAAKSLMAYLGSAEQVFKTSPVKMATIPGIGEKRASQWDFNEALRLAEKELEFAAKHGIELIFYTDARYPKRLKNCADSPILLYSKGKMELNMPKVISIVGTRNATDYGKQLCRQLIEELQQYNVLIASGLALGIDVAAHKECLRLNVPTVGVLGHGLDRMYPSQNRATADKMLENGGLLTEYPSGTVPDRENFPQRNRIVAGMADATVVIEAGLKGGALITAEIANSYNRDVFAFPGRLDDVYSEGCNFLIRNNKAALLTCMADLAFSLGWEKDENLKPTEQFMLPLDLTKDESLIFDILQQHKAPLAIDELTIKANMPMSSLAMNLLNMEMQGYIRSLPGKTYRVN
ncbi:DNA-processing protein DprA [Mucilaginibacter ginsenosidivorax]|uniref:DNA-protecting protein DprA n=1 Tax=Mucilaginibacter ginsenosidivorax TaxID=862126 RepID=A0A5B8VXK9_9SPHI|nr:DNA-processing protein DprA [Mucilaginibacter ginsenosidivorax]QEC74998.1 DNA-protecting protein DprA [Mucilaginibacter ginsenosidivorax]